MWRTPGFNSWSSLFLIYINDLPTLVNEDNNIVRYVDDASIVITDPNRADFNLHVNVLFNDINNWFKNNLLNLNLSKTHYIEFSPSKRHKVNIQIHHNHKYVSNVTQTNFLGLTLDDSLTWKQHTDLLIKKMSSASYALRQVKYSLPIDTLLRPCTRHYELWCNLLGQFTKCQKGIQTTKKNYQNYYKY